MINFTNKPYAAKSSAKRNAIAQLKKAGIEGRDHQILCDVTAERPNHYEWLNSNSFLPQQLPADDGLLHVSAMVGACALVWDIAEQMLKADPSVKRKAILEACTKKGIAYYTARTQYQKYREAARNDADAFLVS